MDVNTVRILVTLWAYPIAAIWGRRGFGTFGRGMIAPQAVGEYVHRQIPGSTLVLMEATGHCPNLSAPEETVRAITAYLDGRR